MGKCFGDGHIFWLDRNLFLLSLGFFLIFSGFQTSAFIVNPVLKTFTGESSLGFYGLAIIYIVNPLSTPLTPVLSESWGPKTLMLVAAAIYCMYVAGIIHPNPIMFLVFAGVCGFGSSSIWTAHGKYLLMLPRASEGYPQTIFFILFQCCLIFGGVAVYVITVLQEGDGASTPTNGGSQFSESLATDMYIFLTAACVVGTLVLLFLADLGKEERQGNLNNAGEAPPVPRAARSRRNLGPQRSQVELVDPSPLLTAHQLEEGHDTAVVAPQPPAVRQPSFGPGGAEGGRRLILAEVVRRVSLIEMDFDLVTTPQPAMKQPKTIKQLFIDTMVVFKHPLIAMSLVLYTYTGVERSWWQTNYAHLLANETSVHLTESWNNKKFIGIAAAFTGVGQIVGGLLTRVFLHHWNKPRVDSDVPGAEQPEARKRLSSTPSCLALSSWCTWLHWPSRGCASLKTCSTACPLAAWAASCTAQRTTR